VKIPADIKPEKITAIIDTREQLPLDLSPLQIEAGTLATGDYSVKGLERYITVERKSAMDMLGCIGGDRERFDKEVQRMLAYPVRVLVIESNWLWFESESWLLDNPRSKITRACAVGSLLGWIADGLTILMADDHERAGHYTARLLFTAARRRYREIRALIADAEEAA